MLRKMTFMILPVGLNCNIACKYCYHGAMFRKIGAVEKMPEEVLKKIIFDASEFDLNIDFLWHGGEPLLAGIEHFKKVIEFERGAFFTGAMFRGVVRNIIQTNMTIFNDNFCDFFAENGFILSTSLDGDKKSHDCNRVFSDGEGTYDKVLESIARWRAKDKDIGAVTLVTESNIEKADKIFSDIKKAGITSCNFHFCSQDEFGTVENMPSREKMLAFLKRTFDLWLEEDDDTFPVRNFRNVLRFLFGGSPLDCTSSTEGCRGFMAINANGDVYTCHRYVERKEFCIGNVMRDSLLDIYNKAQLIYNKLCCVSNECNDCEWLGVCGNGCAFDRLTINGSVESIDPECYVKKNLFAYIRERLKDFS